MPKVYLIEDSAMNAFATGRDPEHASVAITRGLMEKLNREELQAVMAHEMSHVRNFDIRFAMLMAVMVGSIVMICDMVFRSVFFGRRRSSRSSDGGKGQAVMAVVALVLAILAPLLATIIQLAVSRQREYLADASAVELTRNPAGLVSALRKLSGDPNELQRASRGTQHCTSSTCPKMKQEGTASARIFLESRIERIEGFRSHEHDIDPQAFSGDGNGTGRRVPPLCGADGAEIWRDRMGPESAGRAVEVHAQGEREAMDKMGSGSARDRLLQP